MNNTIGKPTDLSVGNNSIIKLIQITDTHILDQGHDEFYGFNTTDSLKNVISAINRKEQDADIILLTGDLVQEPSTTAYQKLAAILSSLTIPLYCLAGNHDDPEIMAYVMGVNGAGANRLVKLGNWLLILLNTHLPGEHGGKLSSDELSFLNKTLERHTNQHVLIALHHHPFSINSAWMDKMALFNGDELLKIIDQYEQVKVIIWGHIHQAFEAIRNQKKFLGTPSTGTQFKPGSDVFALDDKPPGYRKILLHRNGDVNSQVVYLRKH